MYSEQDLNDAVAAGAMPGEAVEGLRRFIAERRAAPAADEEQVRLVTSFNDIFVAIAAIVLFMATSALLANDGLVGALANAALAWGLAEYFTRQRRMALPSILFLVVYASSVFGAARIALIEFAGIGGDGPAPYALAGLVTLGACALHWRRFQVPITIAAGVGAAATAVVGAVAAALDLELASLYPLLLILGLATFIFAMWWDASDVARRTRRSDVAFWLHLLAAPLIAHSLFAMLGVFRDDPSLAIAAIVVAIYVALAVVALTIDRRALMVSALAYVLYAIYTLLEAGGIGTSFALTGVLIGSALLLLSALWQTLRRPLVGLLPDAWRTRVPPVAVAV